MTLETLEKITWSWIAIAASVFVLLFFVKAPFGRHTSEKWGPSINNKLGWTIMEFPSFALMSYFLFWGSNSFKSYVWVLFGCWIIHYFNRVFVYPLRIRPTQKKMPVIIVLNAIIFNLMNAGLNGYYLAELASPEKYDGSWLKSPLFFAGAFLFVLGMYINWRADNILIHLRKPGETGYRIPQGFLFKYISTPNLFGEMIEWTGFAIMAWNLPAFSFMVWTFANLVPRAKNHHDWYHTNFKDYPGERKVVFPFLF